MFSVFIITVISCKALVVGLDASINEPYATYIMEKQ